MQKDKPRPASTNNLGKDSAADIEHKGIKKMYSFTTFFFLLCVKCLMSKDVNKSVAI